ncbi:MAG: ATPase, partial [Flavobacteriales bacterium]|nr:ATPase [Flavobacteriales bacterium]
MILIADSGSTKCDWMIVDAAGTELGTFSTMGLNPYFHDEETVETALRQLNNTIDLLRDIEYVFFYGAGSSSTALCATIQRGLQRVFPDAEIFVDHDLVGAAYSTFDGWPSICCILGTGSNSCYFDGQKIREEVPALAYILGDEGSGSYFGKILLQEYFYKKLPKEIHDAFEAEYHLTHQEMVRRVYNESDANVYLAGFTKFIGKFKEHPHVQKWIIEGMERFLDIHVCCFPEHKEVPIHFVGSVAHYFRPSLEVAMERKGLKLGNVI